MNKNLFTLMAGLFLGATLTACSANSVDNIVLDKHPDNIDQNRVIFQCDGGSELAVFFGAHFIQVKTKGKDHILQPAIASSGSRYAAEGGYELDLKDNQTRWTSPENKTAQECQVKQ